MQHLFFILLIIYFIWYHNQKKKNNHRDIEHSEAHIMMYTCKANQQNESKWISEIWKSKSSHQSTRNSSTGCEEKPEDIPDKRFQPDTNYMNTIRVKLQHNKHWRTYKNRSFFGENFCFYMNKHILNSTSLRNEQFSSIFSFSRNRISK